MAKYSKEVIETAKRLRLIDDTLFRLVTEDIPACQEILRELLDNDGLEVIEAIPQRRLGGLNRNIIVDLLCKTSDGNYINVEVQTGDYHDDFRRTRLHASIITAHETPKDTEFAIVPDVTVLYITEYDAAKQNLPVAVENHYIKAGNILVEVPDGETIIYATTAINDGSSHSKLLQLFLRDDAFDEKDYPAISARVGYFKRTEEGREDMCRAVDELSKKREKDKTDQIIRKLLKNGVDESIIADSADVTIDYVVKIKDGELQMV